MIITSADFKCSSAKCSQCPNDDIHEFAFIGRSNVGKSSLINMLTSRKSLAKVSSTPGKTRLINHFLINNAWYLVDLPGYGYARASKTIRAGFSKIITDYLDSRVPLEHLFILVDSRLEPQKIDVEFIKMMSQTDIHFSIIFTKTDKQSENQTASNVAKYKRFLKLAHIDVPPMLISSSEKKSGREEILDFIEICIKTRQIIG